MSAVSAIPAGRGVVVPRDKVRALQHTLYRTAKADPGRRFHALQEKVCRRDVLWRGWVAVRADNGAPGIDRTTLDQIEYECGALRLVDELSVELAEGRYRPLPARGVVIPKPGRRDKYRHLSISAVPDRIVQVIFSDGAQVGCRTLSGLSHLRKIGPGAIVFRIDSDFLLYWAKKSNSLLWTPGGSAYRFARYSLPIIDAYDYEVQVHETGMVTRGRLVRALSEVPMLQGFSSLHSWSHVASEVLPRLGGVELLERLGASEIYEGDLMVGVGSPQRVGLRFVLELLQEAWIVNHDAI